MKGYPTVNNFGGDGGRIRMAPEIKQASKFNFRAVIAVRECEGTGLGYVGCSPRLFTPHNIALEMELLSLFFFFFYGKVKVQRW